MDKINAELESDIMIRAIHDVKGIDMGNSLVRYKAELDFDGRELTRFYLDKQDLSQLLEVCVGRNLIECTKHHHVGNFDSILYFLIVIIADWCI